MKRGLSVYDALRMKRHTLDFSGEWAEAFGFPEKSGVWFVWGDSGNGKTNFVMQLCKELAKFGKVVYNSLEEGIGLTMQNTLVRNGMKDVSRRFILLDGESMDDLEERMNRRKSPDIYVIDSLQYTGMSYDDYRRFRQANPKKLIIFISQSKAKKPMGATAIRVMFDASLKIYIEGFRAISKGRFIGPRGYYTIWEEGAGRYWGAKENMKENNEKQTKER